MSLIERPRCPNCNSEVDLEELWRAAPKTRSGGSVIAEAVGIACPTCGIKLRVLQARVQIASALVFVLPLGLVLLFGLFHPYYKDREKRRVVLVIVGVIYALSFHLINRMTPRLLRLRFPKDGEQVKFPLEVVASVHKEEAQFIQDEADRESEDIERPSWICPKCHEENPGNFDECWKCQTWRDQASGNPSGKTG